MRIIKECFKKVFTDVITHRDIVTSIHVQGDFFYRKKLIILKTIISLLEFLV